MSRCIPLACVLLATATLSFWAAPEVAERSSLEVSIELAETTPKGSRHPSFVIVFRNTGTYRKGEGSSKSCLLLNGGEMLGNGAEIWSSVQLELTDRTGKQLTISPGWGVPGIAGRVYFLGVPLRTGSSYRLLVHPRDYWIPPEDRLAPGTYKVRCVYQGKQSPYRDDTQLPPCWEGTVRSKPLEFEVTGE